MTTRTQTTTTPAPTELLPQRYDENEQVLSLKPLKKPYLKAQPANWYQQNRFFQHYMLRELTAVPVALEALNLFWGLVSLAGSLDAWQHWVQVQSNILMILFHGLVIVAALYNSMTWFAAMPKAIRVQQGEKFVPDSLLIGGSWVTLLIILGALAAIVAYFA